MAVSGSRHEASLCGADTWKTANLIELWSRCHADQTLVHSIGEEHGPYIFLGNEAARLAVDRVNGSSAELSFHRYDQVFPTTGRCDAGKFDVATTY